MRQHDGPPQILIKDVQVFWQMMQTLHQCAVLKPQYGIHRELPVIGNEDLIRSMQVPHRKHTGVAGNQGANLIFRRECGADQQIPEVSEIDSVPHLRNVFVKVWVLRVNERIDIVRSKPMRFIAEKDIDSIAEVVQVK